MSYLMLVSFDRSLFSLLDRPRPALPALFTEFLRPKRPKVVAEEQSSGSDASTKLGKYGASQIEVPSIEIGTSRNSNTVLILLKVYSY